MTTAAIAKTEEKPKAIDPTKKAALTTSAGDVKTLSAVLEARKGEFAKLLPATLSAEKLLKVAINCIVKTPELQNCSVESVLRCVYASAELGLELGGALGHAYMLPFNGIATFCIGYRGLLKLVNNSGDVSSVRAVVVHKRDVFRYSEGLFQKITHEPCFDSDPGELTLVYSVATMRDGTKSVEFMTRAQVDAIRMRSRTGAKNSGPWSTDFERMACKTVVRRHCNYLPMSDVARNHLEKDDDIIDSVVIDHIEPDRPAESAEKKSKRRLNIIDKTEDLAPALEASIAQASEQAAEAETISEPGSAG